MHVALMVSILFVHIFSPYLPYTYRVYAIMVKSQILAPASEIIKAMLNSCKFGGELSRNSLLMLEAFVNSKTNSEYGGHIGR